MSSYKNLALQVVFILVLVAGLAACQPETTGEPSTKPGIKIGITDGICPNVTIKAGDTVTWVNNGKAEHIVRDISAEGVSQFDSGILLPDNSFEFVFPEPGVYTYVCSDDGTMKGTVTVEP